MGNIFNKDFRSLLLSLNKCKVEYLVVGGYAVILHGYNRTTGDIDIWVNKTEVNYEKLTKAFSKFKLPLLGMTKDTFLYSRDIDVFTYGRPPVCIDIMTAVKGLDFNDSFTKSTQRKVDGILVRLIDYMDLIRCKKASGRYRDLDDINNIEKK